MKFTSIRESSSCLLTPTPRPQIRSRRIEDGVAILSAQYPEYAHLIRAFDERWEEMLGGPVAGTVGAGIVAEVGIGFRRLAGRSGTWTTCSCSARAGRP